MYIINIMIEKITKNIIDKFKIEFNKDENQKKIKKDFFDPIINNIKKIIYPYVLLLFILCILNTITLFFILIINLKK
jgi:hypothetical protein